MSEKPPAYLGIDPGKHGACCAIIYTTERKNGIVYTRDVIFLDWPKDNTMAQIVGSLRLLQCQYNICGTVLEKVSAMPGQGVTSMFSMGQNFGRWEGILASLGIPYETLPPQTWRKGIVTKKDGDNPKAAVRTVIERLFPAIMTRLIGPKGAYKDGRGDALLIAWSACIRHRGGVNA